jgi:hypothetical protein
MCCLTTHAACDLPRPPLARISMLDVATCMQEASLLPHSRSTTRLLLGCSQPQTCCCERCLAWSVRLHHTGLFIVTHHSVCTESHKLGVPGERRLLFGGEIEWYSVHCTRQALIASVTVSRPSDSSML